MSVPEESWQAAVASYTGEGVYEAIVPALPAGRVEYYFKCDFAGFHYYHGPTNTDEDQSPTFLPDADEASGDEDLDNIDMDLGMDESSSSEQEEGSDEGDIAFLSEK